MGLIRKQIFTHRGLEPSQPNFFSESSFEAFEDHLKRGFGIEFDVNFTKDGKIIIVHDAGLKRITNEKDKRVFAKDVSSDEISNITLGNGRIPFLDELLDLIRKYKPQVVALHLKGRFQEDRFLTLLTTKLTEYIDLTNRILIFDAKPETARILKNANPNFQIAPSVAHPFDIERYNASILGTLISLHDALKYKKEGLYDWVWLDEWDRIDKDKNDKSFYNKQTFETLKRAGYKISLVTPELHGTSPGLYGGESHQDAKDKKTLLARIKEIIALDPDAICTDYPEEVLSL